MQDWQELQLRASLYIFVSCLVEAEYLEGFIVTRWNVTAGNTIEKSVIYCLKCQKLGSDNRGIRIQENFSGLEGKLAVWFFCLNPCVRRLA